MGLDMYLTANFYVGGGYQHVRKQATGDDADARSVREVSQFDTITDTLGITHLREKLSGMTSLSVDVHVAYWRKVNAVHSWFVNNVQGGKDECQRSYVDREHLQTLVDICKQILATVNKGEPVEQGYAPPFQGTFTTYPNLTLDTALADRLLAPKQGFFFGSYDYDYWYVVGLEETVKQIQDVLTEPAFDLCEFYYQASW